jgi:PTS system N-acetylgalactosamine-specific IIA component
MVGIVITGHGQFATGLLSSLQLIAGDFVNVAAIDFAVNNSTEDLSKKLKQAVQDFANCEKVMFFTDLVGGSPFRCCVLIGQEGIESKIIAGANLPMLLEIVFARDSGDLEALKNIALEVGKIAIKCFGDEPKVKKNMATMGI